MADNSPLLHGTAVHAGGTTSRAAVSAGSRTPPWSRWSIPPASTASWWAAAEPGSPSATTRSAPSRSTRASTSATRSSSRTTTTSTCCASPATCSTSRSSTSHGRKVVRVNDVTLEIQHDGVRDTLYVLEVDIGVRSIFRRAASGRRCRRAGSAACSARFRPTPSLGVLQRRRARPAAPPAAEHLVHQAGSRCTRPTSPTSSRNSARPSAKRSSRPSTARSAADALSEVEIPRCRPASWNRSNRRRPPTSSRRCRPTRPPTSSSELEEETSEEILDEMDSAPKTEVRELLEFDEDTAGGMMNTEYVALHDNATVADAMSALPGQRRSAGDPEHALPGRRRGAAHRRRSRWRACSSPPGSRACKDLASETLIQVPVDEKTGPRHRTVRQIQPADPARGGRGRQARRRDHRRRFISVLRQK